MSKANCLTCKYEPTWKKCEEFYSGQCNYKWPDKSFRMITRTFEATKVRARSCTAWKIKQPEHGPVRIQVNGIIEGFNRKNNRIVIKLPMRIDGLVLHDRCHLLLYKHPTGQK